MSIGIVLAALVVVPLATADAAPQQRQPAGSVVARNAPDRGLDASSRRAAAGGNFGIPSAPTNNPFQEPYDGKGVASAGAAKLKTSLSLGESTFLSYLKLCTEVIQDGAFDPANCPAFTPPKTTFDSFENANFPIWIQASGPIWVLSPAGSRLRYGSFAPVKVRTLAFGSIPVSATVEVSQPIGRDGLVEPLQLDYLTTASPIPPEGGTVFANKRWGGARFGPNSGNFYMVPGFRVTGQVSLRLRNVTVDGRPLEVGSACRTAPGSRLTLESPAGVYPASSPASTLRGRPGGAQVLNNDDAGSAQGAVSIRSFSGCGSGREDLDPLLTSLISGPGNPLDVAFTRAFTACGNAAARTEPCPAYPGSAPQNAGRRLAAASGRPDAARSSAAWSRLTTNEQREVARRLATLPRTQRALLERTLPQPIARAIGRSGR